MKRNGWDRHALPIGEAVFIARTQMGMTHEDIAAKTGVHRNTLIRLEKGDKPPSLPVLAKISVALGIELSRLVRKAEQIRPTQQ